MPITVQVASHQEDVPGVADIEHWAGAVLDAAQSHAQICVRIVDEAEATALNETYRGRSGPTNVLSFVFDAPERTDPPLLGDIVICAPLVTREADAQHKTSRAHFAHMVVHGSLHLLGHDHEHEQQARDMETLEQQILATLGFANPYALDAAL